MNIQSSRNLRAVFLMFGITFSVAACDLYLGGHGDKRPDASYWDESCNCVDAYPRCGDGYRNYNEQCDDGNTNSGDGCRSDCLSIEICGNGLFDVAAGEQCDDGNRDNNDGCTNQCQLPQPSCAGAITCAIASPTCAASEVPLISNGCYTGQCRAVNLCDAAPVCAAIHLESACLARSDCQGAYNGLNCRRLDGTACVAGDAQCTCESFTFAQCNPRH
jgi:cysteine-rich repeat protein